MPVFFPSHCDPRSRAQVKCQCVGPSVRWQDALAIPAAWRRSASAMEGLCGFVELGVRPTGGAIAKFRFPRRSAHDGQVIKAGGRSFQDCHQRVVAPVAELIDCSGKMHPARQSSATAKSCSNFGIRRHLILQGFGIAPQFSDFRRCRNVCSRRRARHQRHCWLRERRRGGRHHIAACETDLFYHRLPRVICVFQRVETRAVTVLYSTCDEHHLNETHVRTGNVACSHLRL